MTLNKNERSKTLHLYLIVSIAISFVLIVGLACSIPGSSDESAVFTQIAIDMLATQVASGGNNQPPPNNEQPPADQPPAEPPQQDPGVDLQATQNAMSATQMAMDLQATANALQLTQAAQSQEQPPEQEESPPEQPSQPEQPTNNLPDFETWMQSASILLYEDMAGDFSVYRFIMRALDGMGLPYTDVKDALGNYKTQILSAGPGGQGWDLIISGKELRTSVQGEFYVYLNDALNLGSAVIIEEWDMDSIVSGKLSTIMSRCGVEFHRDWIDEPMNEQLLYVIDGTHPIHHYPNEGISLTNPTGYWNWTDQGDLMRLVPGSKATLLWGARTNVKDSYATAAVCVDGRLIIQTYSTHSYGEDRVERMWQNYIYNALKARYDYLSNQ
jgi:hypothetical protein